MFKHILLPLDGSRFAEAALPHALELARKFGGELTLLSVVTPPVYIEDDWMMDATDVFMQVYASAREEAEAYLGKCQHGLHQQGYKVHARVVEGVSVPTLIMEAATEAGADAIVMSTHGRSGLTRWVLGSVAENVLRHATIPVLLVRIDEDEVAARAATQRENEAAGEGE
jgi:nucleotide-binding universal stress UspA family protein